MNFSPFAEGPPPKFPTRELESLVNFSVSIEFDEVQDLNCREAALNASCDDHLKMSLIFAPDSESFLPQRWNTTKCETGQMTETPNILFNREDRKRGEM